MKNQATLVGRFGNNADLKYSKNQRPYLNLSIVTNENYVNDEGEKQEYSEWHMVRVWGKLAEAISQYDQKGKLVFIQGPIKYFEDNEEDKVIPYIRVDEIKYLEKKKKEVQSERTM